MKIAFISTLSGAHWGGSEYLWAATAEQSLKDGHEVSVSLSDLSANHPKVKELQLRGAHLFTRPSNQLPSLLSRVIRKLSKYLTLLKVFCPKSSYQPVFDWKPNVICISDMSVYFAVFQLDLLNLLKNSSIPYLTVSHLNDDHCKLANSTRVTARQFFSKAAYHGFVSHHNLKLAERQLAQSLPNAVVLQNPVNLSDFSRVPWPYKSTICFASVARLAVGHKGQDILFEILSSPIWQQRDWQCHLYGKGEDQSYLEALAQYYGVADRVKFIGHVNNIRSIWSDNHILLLPSREEGGPPIALVEAMLCGRPVVATDVGAVSEWIKDAQTGFIAEAPTIKLFDAALNRAWQAQNDWEQMGIKAHEYATAKLDYSPGQSLLKLILDASKKIKK